MSDSLKKGLESLKTLVKSDSISKDAIIDIAYSFGYEACMQEWDKRQKEMKKLKDDDEKFWEDYLNRE